MGLFDNLKEQALNGLNGLHEKVNNALNEQSSVTSSPAPQSQMVPPPPTAQSSQESSGKGIYGDYVEHLIDMALADGELTEKEKQVLFKKAEASGIDLDEFEMVLDARLYERKKAMQTVYSTTESAAPKSNKLGDVKKCPSCGAIIESFTTRCPDCGHELNGVGVVSSFDALVKKLDEFDKRQGQKTTFLSELGEFLDGSKSDRIIEGKKQIIANFPIPTAREDLLEFLSMAAPLAKKKGNFFTSDDYYDHNVMVSAWKSKIEQVLIKARISMKDDRQTLEEIERIVNELNIK